MARLTPAEFQKKHADRLKASVPDIRAQIDKVTVNPCEQAAAKQDKLVQNWNASVSSGKWKAGLGRVSLEEWKRKARDIGTGRIGAGIDGAKDKVINFANQLLPYVDRAVAEVAVMPDVTLEDSISRMTTFCRRMANFKMA